MYIIIVDHFNKTVFSNLITSSDRSTYGHERVEHELTLRDAGSVNYSRRDLSAENLPQVPPTSALIERSFDLVYIDIVGDLTQGIEF